MIADTNAKRIYRRRVLIVGAGKVGRTLAASLHDKGGHEIVGFLDDGMEHSPRMREEGQHYIGAWPLLGSREETLQIVAEHCVDDVLIAHAPTWQQQLAETLARERPDVQVSVVPTAYETSLRVNRLESYGEVALLPLTRHWGGSSAFAKRALDVVASLSCLFIGMPFLLLFSALIKATSRGPALFRQERIGRDGLPFILYKFRTMIVEAEAGTGEVLSSGPQDARLTKIGRWMRLCRLDELPQLWNVLRGEMSLIGPRPERPNFVHQYAAQIPAYMQRHRVRPGITGLAQVHGGYHTDARDKLRFDLIYVSHGSLLMDLQIVCQTLKIMVFPDVFHAYQGGGRYSRPTIGTACGFAFLTAGGAF